MRRFLLIGFLFCCSLYTSQAEARCDGALYTAENIIKDIGDMDSAIGEDNLVSIKTIGERMARDLLCMSTPAPPMVFATLYRHLGVYYHVMNNPQEGNRWFRSAIEIDPSFEWEPSVLPLDRAERQEFEQQRLIAGAEPDFLEDKIFSLPEGTILYLDGHMISEPSAVEERPHVLLLVQESSKNVEARYLIDGNNFPEVLLTEGSVNQEDAQKVEDDLLAVKQVYRMRPAIKTPLLISSAVTLTAAASMYGVTTKTNASFYEKGKTYDEYKSIQRTNNNLVIGSVVSLVIGVGTGYTGALIDAPASPGGYWVPPKVGSFLW